VSKNQIFDVSRLQGFEISRFQSYEVSMPTSMAQVVALPT
jgi:hypothetical protein